MKRAFFIFLYIMIVFNIGSLIVWLKKYGVSVDFNIVIKAHYAVSIYAIKCGFIAVIVDWTSKEWIKDNSKK